MTRPSLIRDESGVTVIEFAFVIPVFLLLLLGSFQYGHQIYVNAVMQGALEKAARQVSLETAGDSFSAIETKLKSQILPIVPQATITLSAKNYYDYTSVGQPEAWGDSNNDGKCNNNEAFEDGNGNGRWDADRAKTGIGGARDIVELTVNTSYQALFPYYRLTGGSPTINLTSKTYLKSQPFKGQNARPVTNGVCA